MGNITQSVKNILYDIKKKNTLEKQLKSILHPNEYKHIKKIITSGDSLIIYVDSPSALYQFKLQQEEILGKLKQNNINQTSLIFKIGS